MIDFKDCAYELELDLADYGFMPKINMKQYDVKSRFIKAKIYNDGLDFNVTDPALTFRIIFKKPDGKVVFKECEVVENGDEDYVLIPVSANTLAVEGLITGELVISQNDEIYSTRFFYINCLPSLHANKNIIESNDEYDGFLESITKVEEMLKELENLDSIVAIHHVINVVGNNKTISFANWGEYTSNNSMEVFLSGVKQIEGVDFDLNKDAKTITARDAKTFMDGDQVLLCMYRRKVSTDTETTLPAKRVELTPNILGKTNVQEALVVIEQNLNANIDGTVKKAGDTMTGDLTMTGGAKVVGDLEGNVTGNVTGNSTTATRLQTPRKINDTEFNGTQDITTVKWGTQRDLKIGNATKQVDGSANVEFSLQEIGAIDANGNVASATKLQTAREINGTLFDGTQPITTARWGTARNISIASNDGSNVNTTNGVDGSGNITLRLSNTIKATLDGNAGSATKLQTAREINGVAFDGTDNITIEDNTKATPQQAQQMATNAERNANQYTDRKVVEVNNYTDTKFNEGKQYTDQKVAGLVDSAPETLNTLKELAEALDNNPNFATTIATQIGQKADTATVNQQIANVNNRINTKADRADLTALEQRVTNLDNTKANKTEVTDLENRVNVQLGNKAPLVHEHRADEVKFADGETFQQKLNNGSLKGPQGIAGPKGDKGDTGATGPQGLQGIQGATGQTGPKGDTGVTPNITITVNTLAPGTNATIQKGGTAENPTFNIGIPRGNVGQQGLQGVAGPQGAVGPQGLKGDKGDPGETVSVTVNGNKYNHVGGNITFNVNIEKIRRSTKLNANSASVAIGQTLQNNDILDVFLAGVRLEQGVHYSINANRNAITPLGNVQFLNGDYFNFEILRATVN